MSDVSELNDLDLEALEYMMVFDRQSSILVVDDEATIHEVFKAVLDDQGYTLDFAWSGEDALEKVKEKEYNILIVDKNLPGISGIDLMRKARRLKPLLEFIVITGYSSYESAVEALRLGAFDYVEKPFSDVNLVAEKINKALERQQLAHENQVMADQLREAHKDLSKTIKDLGKSIDEVERANIIRHAIVNKTNRQLKIQNTELKQAFNGVTEALRHARAKLKEMAAGQGNGNSHTEVIDLLEHCWTILATQAKKVKEMD
ncbi:MAG: response regulator [Deltaproteobacteria bacterium]|nr:response regulator [Deltaproteobacteria bacterium]